MSSRRWLILCMTLLAGGALLGYMAAAGATGSGADRPTPGANPVKVPSRPATQGEAAAAGLSGVVAKARSRRQTVKTRISSRAVMTRKNRGDFIGLTCPRRYVALSGGAVTGFINLVISHSAPIKPTGRQRYTPRTWWVAVTNIPVDAGAEDPLPWRPVVNCVNRLRVGH
jgi:hypothetical protein